MRVVLWRSKSDENERGSEEVVQRVPTYRNKCRAVQVHKPQPHGLRKDTVRRSAGAANDMKLES